MTPKKGYRRGYPLAIIVGIEDNFAVAWKIFSHVVKPEATLQLSGNRKDTKAIYNFHETIINSIRPSVREGVRSIILASPPKTDYSEKLLAHIKEHHTWLLHGPSKATFKEIVSSAATRSDVANLTRTSAFKKMIDETTAEETESLLALLEKRLNASGKDALVVYSLEDVENLILNEHCRGQPDVDYLLITDTYLSGFKQKARIHRLMQIAVNKDVKTRIINAQSTAGQRIAQLGGIVGIAKVK